MKLDPTVNVLAIVLKSRPRKPKVSKARQVVLSKLSQPALLSDRTQSLRRPTLRLKRTLRTNYLGYLGEQR